MRALVLALYLGSTAGEGDLLSARGMQNIELAKVAELLRVNVYVERRDESLPGVMIGELGGPLYELVKLITDVLNETGQLLVDYGYPNLGSFVLEALEHGRNVRSDENTDAELEVVLGRIVRAFPGFQDMAIVNGQPIYCFKKALFLVHAINVQFGTLEPAPFPVPDTRHSPVFADNVLPTMLIHFGVIDTGLEGVIGKVGGKEEIVVDQAEGYLLRAAAIVGGARMAAAAGRRETEVDMWLWGIAKEGGLRAVGRVAERRTVYY
ncbi:hypothetical protein AX15_004661 [Amanita polypyramis BW_CC]|nr:hypothetical protein AX15_004661 [Amanita polypyramis BW_CC]